MSERSNHPRVVNCVACGNTQNAYLPACRRCGSRDLNDVQDRLEGRVTSWTRVHHRFSDLSPKPPYTIVLVRLTSGARVLGLVDNVADRLRIGVGVREVDSEKNETPPSGPYFEVINELG